MGNPNVTCLSNNQWNGARPVCRYRRCFPWNDHGFANGVRQCTKRNIVGSRCQYYCNAGYMLEGSRQNHCVNHRDMETNGYWSTPVPKCVPVPILIIDPPTSPKIPEPVVLISEPEPVVDEEDLEAP